jgi:uncharacterized protein YgbK (DUF1537 family)
VVADDFTGACDLADAVSDAGASAVVVIGTPDGPPPDCDCVVVALKSRTAARADAVTSSLTAARWLRAAGCTTLYQKYCSTFDSTDDGNIGPVADALAGLVGGVTAGTPATPRVGRTVYKGHLFVGRRLLSESPLRHHPVTPMRDPDLVRVLARQAEGAVAPIDWQAVAGGPDAVLAAVEAARGEGAGHLILDAVTDADLDTVAAALLRAERVVVGGAAGLAAALVRVRAAGLAAAGSPGERAAPADPRAAPADPRAVPAVPAGRRLILSGSCSTRTREQVARFAGPLVPLSPIDLDADFAGTVDAVLAAVAAAGTTADPAVDPAAGTTADPAAGTTAGPAADPAAGTVPGRAGASAGAVLVSSSADPDQVADHEARLGRGRASDLLERATAEIAVRAVDTLGVRRLLVAGGETSGAVVAALGVDALRVGPAAGAGLPWMVPDAGPRLALLLKSGNFGEPDLFDTAWDHCP